MAREQALLVRQDVLTYGSIGPQEMPCWVRDVIREWIAAGKTGSLELHFHRGAIGKVKEHRELTAG
jgi:hypothetical protein